MDIIKQSHYSSFISFIEADIKEIQRLTFSKIKTKQN